MTMAFLLLAALAFYLGLASAHVSKHGRDSPSLMKLWTDSDAHLEVKEKK